jgi:hypothetical protein
VPVTAALSGAASQRVDQGPGRLDAECLTGRRGDEAGRGGRLRGGLPGDKFFRAAGETGGMASADGLASYRAGICDGRLRRPLAVRQDHGGRVGALGFADGFRPVT